MAKSKQTRRKQAVKKQKRSYALPVLIVMAALSVLILYLGMAEPGVRPMIGGLQKVIRGLTGNMTVAMSVMLMYLGVYQLVASRRGSFSLGHVFGVIVLALCVLSGAEIFHCPELSDDMSYYSYFNFAYSAYKAQVGGGVLGSLAWFFYNFMDVIGGFIMIVTIALVTLAILTHAELAGIIGWFRARSDAHAARVEKRREEKELDGMFDYDDFEELMKSQPANGWVNTPRRRNATRPERIHPLYDMEENAEMQRIRSEHRARRLNGSRFSGEEEMPLRPARTAAAPLRRSESQAAMDYEPMEEEMPVVRSRRTVVQTEAASPRRSTSPRPVRTAPEPIRAERTVEPAAAPEEKPAPKPAPKRYFEDEARESEFTATRRRKAASAHPDGETAKEDPFSVIRYRSKVEEPVSGDDFAGGHMRTVHGQSALKGGSISGTVETRPRAGMGMKPVVFDEPEEPEVPLEERDLTIEPIAYEEPDEDEPPFDVPEAPKKQLGTFTRRQKVEVAEEDVYNYPPLDLLVPGNVSAHEDTRDEDLDRAQRLEDTLRALGIEAKLTGIAHGPAVTRFEFEVPLKMLTKISSCEIPIAYEMMAKTVRIEAPIPGKRAVGIEIPNEAVEVVPLRDVLESSEARKQASRIAVALGKDNAGRYIIADIAKMPHVLIAGSTGSGKSVCENAIVMSILYRASPDEVKLILIDPKKVELTGYNGIPHLIAPVVTDANKAAAALDWAVVEMDRRYKLFEDAGVKDLVGYNKRLPEGEKPLPQIVIIIDELADLMLVAAREVEDSICRITQLARAAGMHLVVATQRPSVDVVTGLIKNNMPARISFKVTSQIDSRTILDVGGAEKLLGKGDMIYLLSNGDKMRIQGTWVSEDEVRNVVEYVKNRHDSCYDEDVIEFMNRSNVSDAERDDAIDEECDDRLEEAVEIVLNAGQASISMLQRKMRVGYARAGRLIDEMCRRGIVSEADGAKPREILITKEQFYEAFTD